MFISISAGLFEPEHEGLYMAMQNALSTVNIRQLAGRGRNILPVIEYVDPNKSFDVNRKGEYYQYHVRCGLSMSS